MRLSTLIVVTAALMLPSCAMYIGDEPRYPRQQYAPQYEHPRHEIGVIGLSIGRAQDPHHGAIVVRRVVPEGPAADAGIRPGDRIRAIDGESTRGMTVAEAAHLIRGRAGSAVELRIESASGPRLVTLVRVPLETITSDGVVGGRPPCPHATDRCRDGRPCRHRCKAGAPCDRGGEPAAAPDADDSFAPPAIEEPVPPPAPDYAPAPELWPPTKPGHQR